MQTGVAAGENTFLFLNMLNMESPYDPAIPLVGVHGGGSRDQRTWTEWTHDIQIRAREKVGSREEAWNLVPGMWMNYLWRGAFIKGMGSLPGDPSSGGDPHEEDTELWTKEGGWILGWKWEDDS